MDDQELEYDINFSRRVLVTVYLCIYTLTFAISIIRRSRTFDYFQIIVLVIFEIVFIGKF